MAKAPARTVSRSFLVCVAASLVLTACGHAQRQRASTANAVVPVVTAAYGSVAPTSLLRYEHWAHSTR